MVGQDKRIAQPDGVKGDIFFKDIWPFLCGDEMGKY